MGNKQVKISSKVIESELVFMNTKMFYGFLLVVAMTILVIFIGMITQ